MEHPFCENCAYWHPHDNGKTGSCCVNPPILPTRGVVSLLVRMTKDRAVVWNGTWPRTFTKDFCGSHHCFQKFIESATTAKPSIKLVVNEKKG